MLLLKVLANFKVLLRNIPGQLYLVFLERKTRHCQICKIKWDQFFVTTVLRGVLWESVKNVLISFVALQLSIAFRDPDPLNYISNSALPSNWHWTLLQGTKIYFIFHVYYSVNMATKAYTDHRYTKRKAAACWMCEQIWIQPHTASKITHSHLNWDRGRKVP